MTDKSFTVSVRLMTYMHESFIKDAMDGIMMQQTSFKVEVVVGDDFSTDRTLDIIREYDNTTNIHIRILERKKGDDYWKKRQELGRLYNFVNILEHCTGKYIALLDGDDYWTNPLKLQKQVDFLEAHHDYSICAHKVIEKNEITSEERSVPPIESDHLYSLDDFIKANYTATCSLMYRRDSFDTKQWPIESPFGDWLVILTSMYNSNRKLHVFNEVSGVYRIQETGLHGKLRNDKLQLSKAYEQHLKFIEVISETLLENEFSNLILQKKLNTYNRIASLLSYRDNFFKKVNYKFHSLIYRLLFKLT